LRLCAQVMSEKKRIYCLLALKLRLCLCKKLAFSCFNEGNGLW